MTTPIRSNKNKAVAIVLAILFSYFSWIYTWKFDAWKFWVCLAVDAIVHLLAGFVLSSMISEAIVVLTASGLWVLWAIIDQARKPAGYWQKYHLHPKAKLTVGRIFGRLAIVLAIALPLITWQITIKNDPADFDVKVLSFECGQTTITSPSFTQRGFEISESNNGHFCQLDFKLENTTKIESYLDNSQVWAGALVTETDSQFVIYRRQQAVVYEAASACDHDYSQCCTNYSRDNLKDSCRIYFDVPNDADFTRTRLRIYILTEGDSGFIKLHSSLLNLN